MVIRDLPCLLVRSYFAPSEEHTLRNEGLTIYVRKILIYFKDNHKSIPISIQSLRFIGLKSSIKLV